MAYSRRNQDEPQTYDGKRHRKAIVRRTIDYHSTSTAWMEQRVFSRGPQDRKGVQRTKEWSLELLPPKAYWDNHVTSIATRFAHTSQNKQPFPVHSICWTPEGRRLIMGVQSGEFSLWDGLTFNFQTLQQSHDSAVYGMEWSHDADWMISCDAEGIVKYWQTSFNNVKNFRAHDTAARDLSFSPTDMKFMTCADDGSLKLWDFNQVREDATFNEHRHEVRSVEWHPEKCLIASGSKDRTIRLWDARAKNSLSTLYTHKEAVHDLHWNPVNGNWLLSASDDQLVKLFDIRMMREIQSFRGHTEGVCSVRFHPIHENMFASGGSKGEVLIWNVGEEKHLDESPVAHKSQVWCLDWHPMGHILATGSSDCTVKFFARQRMGDTKHELYNPRARREMRVNALHQQQASTHVTDADVQYDSPLLGFGMDPEAHVEVPALTLVKNPENKAAVSEAARSLKDKNSGPLPGPPRPPLNIKPDIKPFAARGGPMSGKPRPPMPGGPPRSFAPPPSMNMRMGGPPPMRGRPMGYASGPPPPHRGPPGRPMSGYGGPPPPGPPRGPPGPPRGPPGPPRGPPGPPRGPPGPPRGPPGPPRGPPGPPRGPPRGPPGPPRGPPPPRR